jgi:hypothetical protein
MKRASLALVAALIVAIVALALFVKSLNLSAKASRFASSAATETMVQVALDPIFAKWAEPYVAMDMEALRGQAGGRDTV